MEQDTNQQADPKFSLQEPGTTAPHDTQDIEPTPEEIAAAVERIRQEKSAIRDRKLRLEQEAAREAGIRRPWTSEELYKYICYRAEHELGFKLSVDDYNTKVVRMLCRYFSNDPRFEEMGESYSLEKGIVLCGNVGTGKSTLMRLFARNKRQCFNLVSCRKLAAIYAQDGHGIFEAYRGPRMEPINDASIFYQRQVGYCFDDLGTEEIKKMMGNEMNVMEEILQNRYDMKYKYPFTQTHITTNLAYDDQTDETSNFYPGIESIYGTRVRSRMREMFNTIVLDGPDRRK